jgi:hypothetical protein
MENIVENKNKYFRKFYENNIDKLKEKTICPICGGSYDYFNKSRHIKSKKHLKYIEYNKIDDEKDKIIFQLKNKLKI